jgi:hypothetical protein
VRVAGQPLIWNKAWRIGPGIIATGGHADAWPFSIITVADS